MQSERLERATRYKLKIAVDALFEIRNEQGKVCQEFTECKHTACTSSYSSWFIASRALDQMGEIDKTE